MWCTQCGEGVPTLATSSDPNVLVCITCKRSYYLDSSAATPGAPYLLSSAGGSGTNFAGALPKDNTSPGSSSIASLPTQESTHQAFGPPHLDISNLKASPTFTTKLDKTKPGPPKRNRKRPRLSTAAVWSALMLGFMGFTCGASLIGYAMWSGRGELWSLGVPVTLIGQVLLFIGIVLQLDLVYFYQKRSIRNVETLSTDVAQLHAATSQATQNSKGSSKPKKLTRLGLSQYSNH